MHNIIYINTGTACTCTNQATCSAIDKPVDKPSMTVCIYYLTPFTHAGVIKSTGKLIPYIGKLVAHLTALGSALGIEDQTAAIENGPGDANGKCLKILQHWLDVNPNPTWKMLCDKLKVYDTFKAVVTMIAEDLRREQ